jgi:hypothetical protein
MPLSDFTHHHHGWPLTLGHLDPGSNETVTRLPVPRDPVGGAT